MRGRVRGAPADRFEAAGRQRWWGTGSTPTSPAGSRPAWPPSPGLADRSGDLGGGLRVELVALDRVGDQLVLDLAAQGQLLEHGDREVLGVDLEVPAQRRPGVRAA